MSGEAVEHPGSVAERTLVRALQPAPGVELQRLGELCGLGELERAGAHVTEGLRLHPELALSIDDEEVVAVLAEDLAAGIEHTAAAELGSEAWSVAPIAERFRGATEAAERDGNQGYEQKVSRGWVHEYALPPV